MSIKLLEIKKESCPAARLIGKKQAGSPNWNEWWENNSCVSNCRRFPAFHSTATHISERYIFWMVCRSGGLVCFFPREQKSRKDLKLSI